MIYQEREGIPEFEEIELGRNGTKYCICIPVINEGDRIIRELKRAYKVNISNYADIIICDGDSDDGSIDPLTLKQLNVGAILIKRSAGGQGAQLRMGFWWALEHGYAGIITIDGNDKDSIEDVPCFIKKLEEGYDFIQGSRFIYGGRAINTPLIRYLAVRFLHSPIISLTARHRFTDSTNGFRGYSKRYLLHPKVQPFRSIFSGYELLAYLSTRASQLGLKVCEVPVTRKYPEKGKIPTKISSFRGNMLLLKILINNLLNRYLPE